MAQEYSKRKKTKFHKQVVVNELAGYTLQIIQNEKYFPEVVQKAMNPEIINLVLNAAGKVNEANRRRLDKEDAETAYRYRIDKETEAIELLETLMDRIETIEIAFKLKRKKAFTWARKTQNAIDEIKSWRLSEIRKLKELGK